MSSERLLVENMTLVSEMIDISFVASYKLIFQLSGQSLEDR